MNILFPFLKKKKRAQLSEAERRAAEHEKELREAEFKRESEKHAEALRRKNDEERLVAAVTAAITAYIHAEAEEEKKAVPKFRVVAFKRVGGARPWNS